jgi:hypothetical protein
LMRALGGDTALTDKNKKPEPASTVGSPAAAATPAGGRP